MRDETDVGPVEALHHTIKVCRSEISPAIQRAPERIGDILRTRGPTHREALEGVLTRHFGPRSAKPGRKLVAAPAAPSDGVFAATTPRDPSSSS